MQQLLLTLNRVEWGDVILFIFAELFLTAYIAWIISFWPREKAFYGYSKTHIKKVQKTATLWERLSLIYLIRETNTPSVKCWVAFYWFYWGTGILVSLMYVASCLNLLNHRVLTYAAFLRWIFDAIIWSIRCLQQRFKRGR